MELVSTSLRGKLRKRLHLEMARLGYEAPLLRRLEPFSRLNEKPRQEYFTLAESFYHEGLVEHPRLLASKRAYLVSELHSIASGKSIALGKISMRERHARLRRLLAPIEQYEKWALQEFKLKAELKAVVLELESFMLFRDERLLELLKNCYLEFFSSPVAYSEQGFPLKKVAASRKSYLRIQKLWRRLYYYEEGKAIGKLLKSMARHHRCFGDLAGEPSAFFQAYEELVTYALLQNIQLPSVTMGGCP